MRAQGTEPIRIGEINSYTAVPAFTVPYRNGWQLAVEHVNAAGGVLGRKIEVISRDDAGTAAPMRSASPANWSTTRRSICWPERSCPTSASRSAISRRQNKKLFVGGEPLTDALVWDKGNRYTFRLRPSTYMQAAMLVDDAAKLKAKRWVTVAPNYEYGQSAVKWFKLLLAQKQPGVEFVAEQWPALGKIDAGATVAALAEHKPDAIYNVTFGADLTNFVRQGNTRGLFEGRGVVSVLTGEPEYLDPLGDETPEGWIVTGYPVNSLTDPANKAFIDAYKAKYNELPKMGSVVGYALISSIVAGIRKTGSVDTEKMADGFGGTSFATPFGSASWRSLDHQSTLGTYVGKTTLKDGKPGMVDWRYVDGASALPSDAQVKKMRPA